MNINTQNTESSHKSCYSTEKFKYSRVAIPNIIFVKSMEYSDSVIINLQDLGPQQPCFSKIRILIMIKIITPHPPQPRNLRFYIDFHVARILNQSSYLRDSLSHNHNADRFHRLRSNIPFGTMALFGGTPKILQRNDGPILVYRRPCFITSVMSFTPTLIILNKTSVLRIQFCGTQNGAVG